MSKMRDFLEEEEIYIGEREDKRSRESSTKNKDKRLVVDKVEKVTAPKNAKEKKGQDVKRQQGY